MQTFGNVLQAKNVGPTSALLKNKVKGKAYSGSGLSPKSEDEKALVRRSKAKMNRKPLPSIPFTIFEDPPSNVTPECSEKLPISTSRSKPMDRKPLTTVSCNVFSDSASKVTPTYPSKRKSASRAASNPVAEKSREQYKKAVSPGRQKAPCSGQTIHSAAGCSRDIAGKAAFHISTVKTNCTPLTNMPFTIFEDPPCSNSPGCPERTSASTSGPKLGDRKPLSTISFNVVTDSASKVTPVRPPKGKTNSRAASKPVTLKSRQPVKDAHSPALRKIALASGESKYSTPSYWKDVAEDRRVALVSVLKENKQLHMTLKALKEGNLHLIDIAVHVEELTSLASQLMEDHGAEHVQDAN